MLPLEQEVLRCYKPCVRMHVYRVQVPRCCPWRLKVASEEKPGRPQGRCSPLDPAAVALPQGKSEPST